MSATDPPNRGVETSTIALREHLIAHNGIVGLEVLEPSEVERAVRLFHRDGFVVVRDALDAGQLMAIFGSDDYIVRAASGDFCLPGAVEYQPLHSDMRDFVDRKSTPFSSFHDQRGHDSIRDVRAWHGGTPNLPDETRVIPNVEYYAPWFREPMVPGISRADQRLLSAHAQRITRYVVADSAGILKTGCTMSPPC